MAPPSDPAGASVPVHEIRDYPKVNVLVAQLLDRGLGTVRLVGVSKHRLLLAGLRGPWKAVVEIDGPAGPELAAGLDAPGLTVVARHGAADGAACALTAGRVVIRGDAGDALAYRQAGGVVIATGPAGHRAGLEMRGGLLILGGPTGRLAGDRQAGGRIVALGPFLGPHAGHGRLGGRLSDPTTPPDPESGRIVSEALAELRPFLPSGSGGD